MDILTKEQTEAKIGKPTSFWMPQQLVNVAHYVSGVRGIDEMLDQSSLAVPRLVNLILRERGIEMLTTFGFKAIRVALPTSDIVSITIENRGRIEIEKEKSVIGRAILGGILFGPLGAVVGGMSGLQGGNGEVAKLPDYFLIFEYKDQDGAIAALVFHLSKSKLRDADQFFRKHLKDIYNLKD